jgi:hypothetical protein
MTGAVQEVGVDVRAGIHTGEAQTVDGKLAGIAVHIGSRVVSLAGPAEVLVTSTVRDLMTGSGVIFADFSHHELKGVPGTWQLFAVTGLDGATTPSPLVAATAVERIDAIRPEPATRRRAPVFVAAGIGIVVLGAALLLLLGGGGKAAVRPNASHTGSTPAPQDPVTLVRIDPVSDRVSASLRDSGYSFHMQSSLWSVGARCGRRRRTGWFAGTSEPAASRTRSRCRTGGRWRSDSVRCGPSTPGPAGTRS